ncbi:MAG: gamma-glutamyltransferase [Paracoccaceae bacterium]
MRDFHLPGRSSVLAENGMCATSHPLAAQAALEILKNGGNAMDAAIAGAVLLGICEPQMTGIGGDCFVLFSPAGSDEIKSLNGSGTAPSLANANGLREEGFSSIPLNSPHAVTIPCAVDAFCKLSNDWGKLGLDKILQPAIHYAERGVPIAERVAYDLAELTEALNPSGREFYLPWGRAPKVGELFAHHGQVKVLKEIAKHGRDGFYSGEVAEDMVDSLQKLGGVQTMDDFSSMEAFYTNPISSNFSKFELVEHPPNSQGATAILLCNILKHFPISSMDPFGFERTHVETEAAKLAYDARNRLVSDPNVFDATIKMTSEKLAQDLAAKINLKKVINEVSSLTEEVHKDTIYITVVDKDRMAVSLIYSIFHGFGSGIASEKFGVLFQNRGAGFNLIPGHVNEYGANKRPLHTIIPAIVREKGTVKMPFGVMGGQYQAAGHARVLSNIYDFEMDIQTALDAPRSFFENGSLRIERGYDESIVQKLSNLGHNIDQKIGPIGGAQAIKINGNGVLEGASDPRKDGSAIGY